MIRWCSYCQKFLGEVAPLNDFSLTHGICPVCKPKVHINDPELLKRGQEIRDYFYDVHDAAFHGKPISYAEVITRGLNMGVKKSDILFGIVQPVLYDVGSAFAAGKLTITIEHAFTMFCENLLTLLNENQTTNITYSVAEKRERILVCADDNYHTLGVRFFQFYLREAGIEVFCLYPGIPTTEIVELIRLCEPKILGISISMPDQVPVTYDLCRAFSELELEQRPKKIIAGGFYFRTEMNRKVSDLVQVAPFDLPSAIDMFRA